MINWWQLFIQGLTVGPFQLDQTVKMTDGAAVCPTHRPMDRILSKFYDASLVKIMPIWSSFPKTPKIKEAKSKKSKEEQRRAKPEWKWFSYIFVETWETGFDWLPIWPHLMSLMYVSLISMSIFLYVHLSIYSSNYPPIHPSIFQYRSIFKSINRIVYLS